MEARGWGLSALGLVAGWCPSSPSLLPSNTHSSLSFQNLSCVPTMAPPMG